MLAGGCWFSLSLLKCWTYGARVSHVCRSGRSIYAHHINSILYDMTGHDAIRCNVIRYDKMQYNTKKYDTIRHNVIVSLHWNSLFIQFLSRNVHTAKSYTDDTYRTQLIRHLGRIISRLVSVHQWNNGANWLIVNLFLILSLCDICAKVKQHLFLPFNILNVKESLF